MEASFRLPENTKVQDGLKASFASLKGGLALARNDVGRARGSCPVSTDEIGEIERLGADPPAALVELRKDVEVSILSACGVPAPALAIGVTDGTAMRESLPAIFAP